jgi:hypothetical protein
MVKMGFAPYLIKLVMICVSVSTYVVLVNGIPTRRIIPTRGIRQGDPMSPYLFLIYAKVLSSLLSRADGKGELEWVPTSKKDSRLNHLFFANDSLLFCRVDLGHWNKLSNLLKNCELASRQRLNTAKTTIYINHNTLLETRQQILDVPRIPSSQRYDTYLALLALVGKSHTKDFKGIVDRVWKRLQD